MVKVWRVRSKNGLLEPGAKNWPTMQYAKFDDAKAGISSWLNREQIEYSIVAIGDRTEFQSESGGWLFRIEFS